MSEGFKKETWPFMEWDLFGDAGETEFTRHVKKMLEAMQSIEELKVRLLQPGETISPSCVRTRTLVFNPWNESEYHRLAHEMHKEVMTTPEMFVDFKQIDIGYEEFAPGMKESDGYDSRGDGADIYI